MVNTEEAKKMQNGINIIGKIENTVIKISYYNLLNKEKIKFKKTEFNNAEINLDLKYFNLYKNLFDSQVYKLFFIFPENYNYLAKYVHNDGIQLLGEVGIIGISILLSLSFMYFKKLINNIKQEKELSKFVLIFLLLSVLFIQSLVDFSLHIPGISILLMVILSISLINSKKNIINHLR